MLSMCVPTVLIITKVNWFELSPQFLVIIGQYFNQLKKFCAIVLIIESDDTNHQVSYLQMIPLPSQRLAIFIVGQIGKNSLCLQ